MHSLLIITILLLEVGIFSWVDKHLYGTLVTPFSVLAYPYLVVALLAWVSAGWLDFSTLYMPSVVIWILGLAIMWVISTCVAWGGMGVQKGGQEERLLGLKRFEERMRGKMVLLAWILFVAMTVGLFISLRAVGGWEQVGSPEFKDAYMYGWYAHARVASIPILVFLIGCLKKNDRVIIITVAALIVMLTLAQVKGALLEPVIGGLIYRLSTGRLRITIRAALAIIAAAYLSFNVIYVLAMWTINPAKIWDATVYTYLFRHFFYYLFAGVLGFGEAVRNGLNFQGSGELLFSPFINVARLVCGTGPMLAAGTPKAVGVSVDLLDPSPVAASNVFTLFGTLYLYLGPLLGALYVVVMSFIASLIFAATRQSRNPWWIVMFAYVSGQLFFGFFEMYFWHSIVFEVLIYCCALALWSTTIQRKAEFSETSSSLAQSLPI